jgi:hypothetical protein
LAALLLARCCRRRRKDVTDTDKDPEHIPVIISRVQEEEFVPTRHPSAMESIPEQSERRSQDVNKMAWLAALPHSDVVDSASLPEPVYYGPQDRPASYQSTPQARTPTVAAVEEPLVFEPVQRSILPEEPLVSKPVQRSSLPEEPQAVAPATPPPREPTPPLTPLYERAPSLESALVEESAPPVLVQHPASSSSTLTSSASTPPAEPEAELAPEPALRKPSLVERILHPFTERPVEVDGSVEHTPPPRAATLPRPARTHSVVVPPFAAEA